MSVDTWAGLLKRYRESFGRAWKEREQREPLLSHELEFLPAALALRESPVSPAPRVAMWLIVAFAALALLWATFGHIEVVATAQGRVVVSGGTKTVQAPEAAVIAAIHVLDGQAVFAGEVLIELDPTATEADRERFLDELSARRIQVARAEAMLSALDSGGEPVLARPQGTERAHYDEVSRLLNAQHEEYLAQLNRRNAEVARRTAEHAALREVVRKLEQMAPIARERAEDFRSLWDRRIVSKNDYLDREQVRIEQEGELAAGRSKLVEIEAAIRHAESEKEELIAGTRRSQLDSVTEGLERAEAAEHEWMKAATRARRMQLVAPVDGMVQQLSVHTVGGVVTAAQPLLMIAPKNDALEVEAFFENRDIGFVRSGQDAAVKIETFRYTKYGTVPARVMSVSRDAIRDEKRGLIYSSRVRMDRTTLRGEGAEVDVGPGMAVTVEVKTGRRRIVEYFLSPLLQYRDESLRER